MYVCVGKLTRIAMHVLMDYLQNIPATDVSKLLVWGPEVGPCWCFFYVKAQMCKMLMRVSPASPTQNQDGQPQLPHLPPAAHSSLQKSKAGRAPTSVLPLRPIPAEIPGLKHSCDPTEISCQAPGSIKEGFPPIFIYIFEAF